MAMEIVRVREDLMGAEVLIAKVKAEPALDFDDMLSSLLQKDRSVSLYLFKTFIRHVDEVSWGAAAQIWAGHSPSVLPFDPQQPWRACRHPRCHAKGTLEQKDIISLVISQHKPDWTPFYDFMETQRAGQDEPKESATQLRLRLQRSLDKVHDEYLEMMHAGLAQVDYPHHDFRLFNGEQQILKL